MFYDWNDWTAEDNDEFMANATKEDLLNFELLLFAADAQWEHEGPVRWAGRLW